MLRETGALISLQPNASRIASAWGLDRFLAPHGPMEDKAFRMFDQSGKLVREIRLDDSAARFGAARMLYHRQDLHAALREAAESPDLAGRPAEVRAACPVVACDPDAGTVTLDSGEVIEADVIVGADGIHSVVRDAVVGNTEHKAVPTGISAYRILIPAADLADLDVPRDVLDLANPVTTMIVGHDRRVIMGPGRNGTVFGVVALVPDQHMREESSSSDADAGSWVAEGSVDALVDAYAGFPAWLHALFRRAPDVALWQLRDVDPLPRWVRGRAVLVGDAAHAMLPTQGQGASQSFEDAEALQAFLADVAPGAGGDEVNDALLRAFDARFERASLIQRYSRDQARPGTDAGSGAVRLDPGQFMVYNCDYRGAKEWVARREGVAAA